MTIKVGDSLPETTLHHMTPDGPGQITTGDLFGGKKAVLFALPGAFTPACSAAHLPGFVAQADNIRAKGVDAIVCLAVNDAFVMDAWGKTQNADEIQMVSDGNGALTEALGLSLDLRFVGLGVRSQRYAMIVDNGVVTELMVDEDPGTVEASSAEKVLALL